MAENKKSFIIYTSWKIWLDALTNEQKGQWLNWMMAYTNDLNPEYPDDDVVKMACLMTQETLKRDLKKYKNRCEKNLKNINKRWADYKEKIQSNTIEYNRIPPNYDNDNDNDNDILKKECIEKKKNGDVNTSPHTHKSKIKHHYGKFNRVMLTDDELSKLYQDFDKDYITQVIDLLDEYIESNNNKNKYRNYNLVIRKAIKERWFNLPSHKKTTNNNNGGFEEL